MRRHAPFIVLLAGGLVAAAWAQLLLYGAIAIVSSGKQLNISATLHMVAFWALVGNWLTWLAAKKLAPR